MTKLPKAVDPKAKFMPSPHPPQIGGEPKYILLNFTKEYAFWHHPTWKTPVDGVFTCLYGAVKRPELKLDWVVFFGPW